MSWALRASNRFHCPLSQAARALAVRRALLRPAGPSPVEALSGDLFAPTIDGATADLVASFPQPGIIHSFSVVGVVGDGLLGGALGLGMIRQLPASRNDLPHPTFPQLGTDRFQPLLGLGAFLSKGSMGDRRQILGSSLTSRLASSKAVWIPSRASREAKPTLTCPGRNPNLSSTGHRPWWQVGQT